MPQRTHPAQPSQAELNRAASAMGKSHKTDLPELGLLSEALVQRSGEVHIDDTDGIGEAEAGLWNMTVVGSHETRWKGDCELKQMRLGDRQLSHGSGRRRGHQEPTSLARLRKNSIRVSYWKLWSVYNVTVGPSQRGGREESGGRATRQPNNTGWIMLTTTTTHGAPRIAARNELSGIVGLVGAKDKGVGGAGLGVVVDQVGACVLAERIDGEWELRRPMNSNNNKKSQLTGPGEVRLGGPGGCCNQDADESQRTGAHGCRRMCGGCLRAVEREQNEMSVKLKTSSENRIAITACCLLYNREQ